MVGALAPPWFHALVETVQRRWGLYDLPNDIEGLVVSPGGVATTMLLEHLGQFINVNALGDEDGLKHRPRPPRNTQVTVPALVVVGNPAVLLRSLEARGLTRHQFIRLGSFSGALVPFGDRVACMARSMWRLRRQWESSWPRTLVVDYDEIWDRVNDIAQHFGVSDRRFVQDFPPKLKRTSDPGIYEPAASDSQALLRASDNRLRHAS